MRVFVLWVMLVNLLFAVVDINNADAKSFQTLKGVGVKKAAAIVEYRNLHGCFVSVEALIHVKGIGKKTLEKNRADLVVGKCNK